MRVEEDGCVDCGLPCIGRACPNRKIIRFYCDKCKDETDLYYFDGQELCIYCIEKQLEKVEE